MSDKDTTGARLPRREVLAGIAGTALSASTSVMAGKGPDENPVPGQSLKGKRVFSGPDSEMPVPSQAARASLSRADVALLSSETRVNDEEISKQLNSGTVVSLTGNRAGGRTFDVLYPNHRNKLDAISDADSSFDGSHGIEFNQSQTGQVVLRPVEAGNTTYLRSVKQSNVDIDRGGRGPPNRNEALVALDAAITGQVGWYRRNRRAVVRRGGESGGTDSTTSTKSYSESDRTTFSSSSDTESPEEGANPPNDWKSIGEDTDLNNFRINGKFVANCDKAVTASYAPESKENDGVNDYFAFETIQSISAAKYSDAEPASMTRQSTLYPETQNNTKLIPLGQWGPQQTNTTESESVSIGLSSGGVSVPSDVNLAYEYSTTSKEVEVTKARINDALWDIDNDGEDENFDRLQHRTEWDIKRSAADSTIPGQPGHLVELDASQSKVTYTFESDWGVRYVPSDTFSRNGIGDWEK